jgi:hypothetical protein
VIDRGYRSVALLVYSSLILTSTCQKGTMTSLFLVAPAPPGIRPVDASRLLNLARMLRLVTQQATESLCTTGTSWQYHTAEIEPTRWFIVVSTRAASLQYFRPPANAVPITVLLGTPTLLGVPSRPCRLSRCTT